VPRCARADHEERDGARERTRANELVVEEAQEEVVAEQALYARHRREHVERDRDVAHADLVAGGDASARGGRAVEPCPVGRAEIFEHHAAVGRDEEASMRARDARIVDDDVGRERAPDDERLRSGDHDLRAFAEVEDERDAGLAARAGRDVAQRGLLRAAHDLAIYITRGPP
jgi:hypothetical protein